jgi:hypothetical protein
MSASTATLLVVMAALIVFMAVAALAIVPQLTHAVESITAVAS